MDEKVNRATCHTRYSTTTADTTETEQQGF